MRKTSEEENFRKFLRGTFLIKGWNARVKEILQKVPSEEKNATEHLLFELGKKIGREWARDKKVRKIDSTMLHAWGKELKSAAEESPQRLVNKLKHIEQEVEKILFL